MKLPHSTWSQEAMDAFMASDCSARVSESRRSKELHGSLWYYSASAGLSACLLGALPPPGSFDGPAKDLHYALYCYLCQE